MLAGIALVAPVWITVIAVGFLFRVARSGSLWLVSALLASPLGGPVLAALGTDADGWQANGLDALAWHGEWLVSIVAVAVTAGVVYGAGLASMLVVGRRAIGLAERLVEQVPLVATVYGASKKVAESLASEDAQPFQEVVLIAFPTPSARAIAFVTRRWTASDKHYAAVFVPTTPNPTSGFLLVVEPHEIHRIDMTIDEAVAVVMSGGVLIRPDQTLPR